MIPKSFVVSLITGSFWSELQSPKIELLRIGYPCIKTVQEVSRRVVKLEEEARERAERQKRPCGGRFAL